MLTSVEKKIISIIGGDIPITKHPYKAIAKKIGTTEKIILNKLKEFSLKGIIRRFGATIRHQKSGYTANAMVAWNVDEKLIEDIGNKLAQYKHISHCYQRKSTETWPYNLYTMVHAKNENACHKAVNKMSKKMQLDDFMILFSKKEFKKTSMKYFSFE